MPRGIDWNSIGSANAPQLNLVNLNPWDAKIAGVNQAAATIDAIFRDKRAVEVANDNARIANRTGIIQADIAAGTYDDKAIADMIDMNRPGAYDTSALASDIAARKAAQEQSEVNQNSIARDKLAMTKTEMDMYKTGVEFNRALMEQDRLDRAKKTADMVYALPYAEQDKWFNEMFRTNPELAGDVYEMGKSVKGRYEISNNLSQFSDENIGIAKNLRKQGKDPNAIVPTKNDESIYHTVQKLYENGNADEALNLAKTYIPSIDEEYTRGSLYYKMDEIAKKAKYDPSVKEQIAYGVEETFTSLKNALTFTGPTTTALEHEILKAKKITEALPEGKLKIEAEDTVAEYEELLKQKKKGTKGLSKEIILRRLKNQLPGLAEKSKKNAVATVNGALGNP